jgi:hypothetical protein
VNFCELLLLVTFWDFVCEVLWNFSKLCELLWPLWNFVFPFWKFWKTSFQFSELILVLGKHIFQNALLQFLKDKSVLFITNQLQFLPEADHVYFLEQGKCTAKGKKPNKECTDWGLTVLVSWILKFCETFCETFVTFMNFCELLWTFVNFGSSSNFP